LSFEKLHSTSKQPHSAKSTSRNQPPTGMLQKITSHEQEMQTMTHTPKEGEAKNETRFASMHKEAPLPDSTKTGKIEPPGWGRREERRYGGISSTP
jgi:hypothetical protein